MGAHSVDPLPRPIEARPIPLDRDLFLRSLLRHLAGTLQEVIGLDEASGLVSVVGQRIGDEVDRLYRESLGVPVLSSPQVARVLVDFKRRIQGDFRIVEESDEKIVLANRACPFGDKVAGRPALCMMTSNVFGSVAAANLGYAKVSIEESIAAGQAGCRVVVYLKPGAAADAAHGREYNYQE